MTEDQESEDWIPSDRTASEKWGRVLAERFPDAVQLPAPLIDKIQQFNLCAPENWAEAIEWQGLAAQMQTVYTPENCSSPSVEIWFQNIRNMLVCSLDLYRPRAGTRSKKNLTIAKAVFDDWNSVYKTEDREDLPEISCKGLEWIPGEIVEPRKGQSEV